MKALLKYLLTGTVVVVAVAVVLFKYWEYVVNPWTRDGQVRAQVVEITPRISGPIVKLPIRDNQFVKTGDLLFVIDKSTFQAAVHEAEATVQQSRVSVDEAKDEEQRAQRVRRKQPGAISAEDVTQRVNARRGAEAAVEQSIAALESAQLDLQFTEVRAPVDGYITNLDLRIGSQAVANSPALALVDVNSYWVHGFFRENYIADIRSGDRAVVTLMTYPDTPLEGRVDSLGWGIAQQDGSTSYDLLPLISPTFEWIRLAQRVPVRVHFESVPDEIKLRVGTTASVLVMTGSGGSAPDAPATAAPRALQ
jgi:multidrug resistance efflux pump